MIIYFWVINTIFSIIFRLYHEFWHWLFGNIYYYLQIGNIASKSILYINGYPTIQLNNNDGLTFNSVGMMVCYEYYNYHTKWTKFIQNSITFAPCIGYIFLFIVSPIYLYPLYLYGYNDLFLSRSDLEKLNLL